MDEQARGTRLEGARAYAWMLTQKRWCVWSWVPRRRKDGSVAWTKAPSVAGAGRMLRSNDTTGGRSYEVAVAAVMRGEADGIGWIATGETRIAWFDLDHCRNPATGETDAWALAVMAMLPGAAREVTPSGTGWRIFGLAGPDMVEAHQGILRMRAFLAGLDDDELEMWGGTRDCHERAAIELFYSCARYLTATAWDSEGSAEVDVGDVFMRLWGLGQAQAPEGRQGARGPLRAVAGADGESRLGPIEDVAAALAVIPNQDEHWNEWSRIGMAVFGATGGSADGFEAWSVWSARSDRHDPAGCEERWDHWGRSPPTELGIGALMIRAGEVSGGTFRRPSRLPTAEFTVEESAKADVPPAGGGKVADSTIAVMAKGLAYVLAPHRFLDRRRVMLLDEARVNALAGIGKLKGAHVRGKSGLVARLLAHPDLRVVDTLGIQPGGPEIFDDVNEHGRPITAANMWRPSRLVPKAGATDADAGPWLEHARRLIPDEADRERVLNRLAWALQNPGIKMNSALVLLGGQGTGKDTLLEPFWKAVGPHNMTAVLGMHIGGEFNGYLQSAWILISEMPHARKRSSYEEIKAWLTTPPTHIRINMKGLEPFTVRNVVNVIVTTNHAGAIAMAEDDRRFDVVLTIMAAVWDDEPRYYPDLYAWFANGGDEAVAGWLMARDVSAFNPNKAPPVTEAKETMRREGAHPFVAWVMSLWDVGGPLELRELVTLPEVMGLARLEGGLAGPHPAFAKEHVLQALRLGGWQHIDTRIDDGGERVRPWTRSGKAKIYAQSPPKVLKTWLENDRKKQGLGMEF